MGVRERERKRKGGREREREGERGREREREGAEREGERGGKDENIQTNIEHPFTQALMHAYKHGYVYLIQENERERWRERDEIIRCMRACIHAL